MNIFKLLIGTSLTALVLTSATPASAQAVDDIGFDLLQLLVDEGLISREKAQGLLERARASAELRQKREVAANQPAVDIAYVPQVVREEIKAEAKAEMLKEAREGGLLAPDALPAWVKAVKLSGDFRVRFQSERFDPDNFPFFPDVAAINAAGGVADAAGFPLLNSTVNRKRAQFRGRFNVEATVSPNVAVGFGLAGGQVPGAVSTGSLLGDFYDPKGVWIDNIYARFTPAKGVDLTVGRMPNPFYSTDMVWDPDIRPEGAVLSGRYQFNNGIGAFATAGVLPLQERERFADSYLYAGQIGVEAPLTDGISAKLAAAYYYYDNLQSMKNPADGSRLNDWSAPAIVARGNSVFNMRTDGTTTLAGLAANYELVAGTGRIRYSTGEIGVGLTGEVVKNLGLDTAQVARLRGEPGVTPGSLGWQVRLDAGYSSITRPGQWRAAAAYKRIETDAVLDLFTDGEFGLGGTDVKGYVLEAEYGIFTNTGIELRYLSSDSINRPPLAIDVLQINLNTRF
ncbi:putative porin [Sphingomonas hengshuiensis]|uniref:Porin n=1 Tax=Sphingomonas hengshuiensis TaxID=1609977 RepID=A0A7U4J6I4_9SPHN|nr:putative porin [Sphingomonas hengshuiensis]AJP71146.1 hypothetical protein TS85_03890 [Sphingomonas hengshuiensis]